MTYVVTTPSFSGPFQLLVELITRHEVDVRDVAIAPIVDEFVATLRATTDGAVNVASDAVAISVDELSEFLLLAAVLVEMKSRSLLPRPDEFEPEEEFVGWQERDVWLARLLELRTYGALADALASLLERAGRAVARVCGVEDDVVVTPPDLLAGVTPADLARAYVRGVEEKPVPVVRLHHVTVDAVSVAETVVVLAQRLPSLGRVSFRALTAGLSTRIEVIVHFLALLELCKLGHVSLGQGATFGEVEIEWVAGDAGLDVGMVDTYEG